MTVALKVDRKRTANHRLQGQGNHRHAVLVTISQSQAATSDEAKPSQEHKPSSGKWCRYGSALNVAICMIQAEE
jgi:hypothetical protein